MFTLIVATVTLGVIVATTLGAHFLLTHLVISFLLYLVLVAIVRLGVVVRLAKGRIVSLAALLAAVWLVVTMMDYPIMAMRVLISVTSTIMLIWALMYEGKADEDPSHLARQEAMR